MLIDTSYFYGDLDIPQKTALGMTANLAWFINQYEEKYLNEMLGYELYRDFKAGIVEDPADQKWIDLRDGKEYTNRHGHLSKWKGLRFSNGFTLTNTTTAEPIRFKIGDGGANTPIAGAAVYTNSALAGSTDADLIIFRSGTIQYPGVNYTLESGGGFSLIGLDVFGANESFTIINQALQVATTPTEGMVLQSPIANYVYYWYMRNNATTTAGSGEAKANVSVPVSPADKMCRAWNQMVEWNRELFGFLTANNIMYSYNNTHCRQNLLTMINPFGI